MQKIFSVLVLTSFFAVLLTPMMVSADVCFNCQVPAPQACSCEGGNYPAGAIIYCFNDKYYSSPNSCDAAMKAAGYTSDTGGGIRTVSDLEAKIVKIGGIFSKVLFAVAGVMMIWAAFLWVTAGGSPETIGKARTMLINALVGTAIAVAAKGFVSLITNIIG